MINISFSISNPHSDRFRHILSKGGGTPIRNKYWEFELLKTNDIIRFHFLVLTRCSHERAEISLGFLGWAFSFQVYDNRHWDYMKGGYE